MACSLPLQRLCNNILLQGLAHARQKQDKDYGEKCQRPDMDSDHLWRDKT